MRQRRAEALQADPDAHLRSIDDMLYPAVAESIEALDLGPEDTAVAQLALQLAGTIDAARDPAWAARWLMPNLLAALEALHATPLARARAKVTTKQDSRPNWLAEMRAARPRTPGGTA